MAEFRAVEGATGEEDITVSTVVKSLTVPSSIAGPTDGRAIVQVRDQALVYTINGVTPTAADASTGLTLAVDDILIVSGTEVAALKMIRASGTDSKIHVRFERRIT